MKILKNKYSFVFAGILGVFLMLVNGCIKDETWNLDNIDDTVDVNVELAAPIAKGTISVLEVMQDWDILDTTKFKFDEDSLLYFEEFADFKVVEYIDVDFGDVDTLITFFASDIAPSFVMPPNSFIKLDTFNVVFKLNTSGGELYSAIFEDGIFGVEGVTGFGDTPGINEKYTIVIPKLKKDGVVFRHTFDGANFSGTKLFSLDGYDLEFEKGVEGTQVLVKIVYAVTNTTDGYVTLDLTDPLEFTMKLQDVDPYYVEGYLDPEYFLEKTEEVDLPLLSPEYLQDSTVFFFNPQVEIILENNVGVPFGIKFNELMVVNSATKDSIDLDYEKTLVKIAAATGEFEGNNLVVTSSSQTEVITRENSSIHEILNKVYNKARISYQLIANPDGTPEVNNFLKVDEGIQMDIKTHTIIPLWAKVDGYLLNDTIDFDFQAEIMDEIENDTANLNKLDSLELVLNIENKFPIELYAQLYILNESDEILDSLLMDSHKLLEAAPINGEGIPNGFSKSNVVLVYGEDKLDKWKEGKKIVFDVEGNSTDISFVKIYANQGVNYTLGFYTKGNVDDELLDADE